MPAQLSPNAKQQFFTNTGELAAGYLLYTYAANTTTPLATYSNRAGTVANPNPIIMDARGEATVYLTTGLVYDYVLKTPLGATEWTREDIEADPLATDLASTEAGKGAEMVGFRDLASPAFLKTTSDLLNGIPVNVLRNIDKSRWAGIQARTDTEDCAAAIMDLMDGAFNVGAKQIILRLPLGTFTIHQPIQRLAGSVSFRLIGDDNRRSVITRGSDWGAGVGTGSVFNISGVDGHSIENLRIVGNNALYPVNANHAVACSNSNHITYRNLYIEDWKNSGILVFHYPGLPPPLSAQEQNNLIENCYLDGNGNAQNGILFVDQYYSYMRGCTVRDLGNAGTPQSALQFKNRCYRSHIHNCVAINARHGVALGQEDVVGTAAEQCSISDVIIKDCIWGIYTGQNADCSFSNINIDMNNGGSHAIEMRDAVDNVFTDIKVKNVLDGSGAYAVKFGGASTGNVVRFSKVTSAAAIPEIGLYESTSSNNDVTVDHLKTSAPITYAGQCFSDANTSATSGNSWEINGWRTQSAHTIATGAITVKNPKTQIIRVDTEAAAATDDLDTINGPGRDGQVIELKTQSNSRDVTVKHGTGNISLAGGADFVLDALNDRIALQWTGGINKWCEVSRSNNA